MTPGTSTTPATVPAVPVLGSAGPARVFLAVLWRDIFVTGRELGVFLAQVVLQPLFLLFVFGKVLTELGYARADEFVFRFEDNREDNRTLR